MLIITPDKKAVGHLSYTMTTSNYKKFLKAVSSISYTLAGRPTVLLELDKSEDIYHLIDSQASYDKWDITLLVRRGTIPLLVAKYGDAVSIKSTLTDYDILLQKIIDKRLIVNKQAVYSIVKKIKPENYDSFVNALSHKYGTSYHIHTEDLLCFPDYQKDEEDNKDMVYPVTALRAYLNLQNNRAKVLEQAERSVGREITYRAIVRNLKELMNDLEDYLNKGVKSYKLQRVPINNFILLYQVYVTNQQYIVDSSKTLFYLFERSTNDNDIYNQNSQKYKKHRKQSFNISSSRR